MAAHSVEEKSKRKKVTFCYESPGAEKVCLIGDFNGWNEEKHLMKNAGNGLWEKSVLLAPGAYEYKFLVDNQWKQDPRNDQVCTNCFGTQNNLIFVK